MTTRYDVMVAGLGAAGSAALHQLAGRGVKALGIDRFAPPHDRGSSHGDTRITRLALGEGGRYLQFAKRSCGHAFQMRWIAMSGGRRWKRCTRSPPRICA